MLINRLIFVIYIRKGLLLLRGQRMKMDVNISDSFLVSLAIFSECLFFSKRSFYLKDFLIPLHLIIIFIKNNQ